MTHDMRVALIINTDYETKVLGTFIDVDAGRAYEKGKEELTKMESAQDERLGANYDVVIYESLTQAFNGLIYDNIEYAKKDITNKQFEIGEKVLCEGCMKEVDESDLSSVMEMAICNDCENDTHENNN
jgi:hypothetical protein